MSETTMPPPPQEETRPEGGEKKKKTPTKKKKQVDRQTKMVKKQAPLATQDQSGVVTEEDQVALDEVDDYASAWRACQAEGRSWGGRGFGGRGVHRTYQCMSALSRDVVVDGVTLAFLGKELLNRTTLRFVAGRRYLLTGRNGVGKTTLLRRIATHSVPGLPAHLKIGYVPQEPAKLSPEEAKMSALEALVNGACKRHRRSLELERDALEDALARGAQEEDSKEDEDDVDALAARLCDVEAQLEETSDGDAVSRATAALKALGFKKAMREKPAGDLSGGWRARVELAAIALEDMDLILLDEPTNHLDLKGVFWLEQYLTTQLGKGREKPPTVVFVTHDRAFADAVATDVVVFEDKQLNYFHGDLATFDQRQDEQAAAQEHRMDARVRQETQARESAEKMKKLAVSKNKKHLNDNQVRAAKQRLAKIDRIGLFRDDGKKFKTHSLQAIGTHHLPSKVEAKRAAKEDAFTFPVPSSADTSSFVTLDGLDVGYPPDTILISKAVASIESGSRIAVCGDNGAGKSTLLKTIAGLLVAPTVSSETPLRIHPKVRIAYVAQDHAASLMAHAASLDSDDKKMTATSYLSRRFSVSELEARSKLGKFGIAGAAKVELPKLSGGQKARLSLAALTWQEPHVLLVDEPTNHLDAPALDALAAAIAAFQGAVVVVSHNRAFLSACCNELWTIDAKKLAVHRDADFNDLFAAYAAGVLTGTGGLNASGARLSATAARLGQKADALDKTSSSRNRNANRSAGAAAKMASMH